MYALHCTAHQRNVNTDTGTLEQTTYHIPHRMQLLSMTGWHNHHGWSDIKNILCYFWAAPNWYWFTEHIGHHDHFKHLQLYSLLNINLFLCVSWNICGVITVSTILHHIHPCLIYEAIMRHIRDKYEAIMKQISIILEKMKCWVRQFLFTAKPL